MSEDHEAEIKALEASLQQETASEVITFRQARKNWEHLSREVADYDWSVYDYTNELSSRNALDTILSQASKELRARLEPRIAEADQRFKENTTPDEGQVLRNFYKIRDSDRWWWHRIPKRGSLRDELLG